MKLLIDADSLPAVAKELLIKTANRTQTTAVFVANRFIHLPPSVYLTAVVVSQGFDVADNYIAKVDTGDLVITSDTPLAGDVLEKGAKVLTPRDEALTLDNIKPKLNVRDFMESLRGTNVLDPQSIGGQKPYGNKDKIAFANGLNRLVTTKPTSNNK